VGHEENNPYIKTDARTIGVILKNFELTLKDIANSNNKTSYVVWKMCMSVSKLAVNDANKAIIGKLGGINMLYQALIWDPPEGADDDHELRVTYAITGIWNLCFLPQNQTEVKKMPELVAKLQEQRWVVSRSIRNAASGCLFLLGLHSSQTQPDAKAASSTPSKGPHVMLSYCWAEQETMMRVKTSLTAAGFQVWIDVDDMQGHTSTLEAMAHAVENASHVVVALSPGYKESPNCRLEAEYAVQKNKRVIPIVVHPGYKPDGWLGILLGAKLFYDLTGTKFEDNVRGLIKDLRGGGLGSGASPLSAPPSSSLVSHSAPPPPPSVSSAGEGDMALVLKELAIVKQQNAELKKQMQEMHTLLQQLCAKR